MGAWLQILRLTEPLTLSYSHQQCPTKRQSSKPSSPLGPPYILSHLIRRCVSTAVHWGFPSKPGVTSSPFTNEDQLVLLKHISSFLRRKIKKKEERQQRMTKSSFHPSSISQVVSVLLEHSQPGQQAGFLVLCCGLSLCVTASSRGRKQALQRLQADGNPDSQTHSITLFF